jgi:hypothetical protein
MTHIRTTTCKCGRKIVANDEELKISHEEPECDWFKNMMTKAAPHKRSVEVLDAETGKKPPHGEA